jgi:hypothetical protein
VGEWACDRIAKLEEQLATAEKARDEARAEADMACLVMEDLNDGCVELEHTLSKWQPVIEAAKAWRAVRMAPFPPDAVGLTEMLEPESRAVQALDAAIDSLTAQPADEERGE